MQISTKARSGTFPITIAALAVLAVVPFLPFGDRMHFVLTIGVIYAIAAVGIDIWSGYTGQLTFGNFAFIAIGAYASAIMAADFGWTPWATLFASLAAAGIIGLVLGAAT